jgi:hypothetical protein
MAEDRLGLVKLQGHTAGELFAVVLVSGSAHRRNFRMTNSPRPLTERRVRDTLTKAGITTDEVTSLLQHARDAFRATTAYTIH